MSSFGYVALKEKGPWHEYIGSFLHYSDETYCHILCAGWRDPFRASATDWRFWRLSRPPKEQMCKRCLAVRKDR